MEETCECGNEPSGSMKCGELTSCKPVSFSRRTLHHGVGKEQKGSQLPVKKPVLVKSCYIIRPLYNFITIFITHLYKQLCYVTECEDTSKAMKPRKGLEYSSSLSLTSALNGSG